MPISTDSMNKDLYKFLRTKGFDPMPKDSDGQTIPVPDEAEVFKFTFKQDGKDIGPAWVTIDGNQNLRIYYDDKDDEKPDEEVVKIVKPKKPRVKKAPTPLEIPPQQHIKPITMVDDIINMYYLKER